MFMWTWDYSVFLIEPVLASLEHIFDSKMWDFSKKCFSMFDKSVVSADIDEKKVKESCVLTVLSRIHNIGHIHNTNFAQSQFSMSYPQKTHFLRNWEFTCFENISFASL